MILKQGIQLQLSTEIKDSDYIVKICSSEEDSYLNYKRKNFLNNKNKDQMEVIQRIQQKMKYKKEKLSNNGLSPRVVSPKQVVEVRKPPVPVFSKPIPSGPNTRRIIERTVEEEEDGFGTFDNRNPRQAASTLLVGRVMYSPRNPHGLRSGDKVVPTTASGLRQTAGGQFVSINTPTTASRTTKGQNVFNGLVAAGRASTAQQSESRPFQ